LVKWFLAIPHFVVLAFLWVGFMFVSIAAFFSILFTGRYPKALFNFNVGVMRWSWRVSYYAYNVLGTDRYPPFTLAEVPDYPAHLEVVYPEHLSRGLVLVKWWLLAIPHYLIVGLLAGGTWFAWQNENVRMAGPGLIGLLVLIAAVTLMFTGKYPRALFDLILGFNRWTLRVAAYSGLMTDVYPPFRLDQGGSEPDSKLTVPPPTAGAGGMEMAERRGGSVGSAIAGGLLTLIALGFLAVGGVGLWADRVERDSAGFLSIEAQNLSTGTHAIVAEDIDVRADGPNWAYPSKILGEARVRVGSTTGDQTFIGVARAADVRRYLDGASYATVDDDFAGSHLSDHAGARSLGAPSEQTFWVASTAGSDRQTLTWDLGNGSWSVVAMNVDGHEGMDVRADIGAKIPALPWVAGGVLAFGALLLLLGIGLSIRGIRH
jgi:hypothetical protein